MSRSQCRQRDILALRLGETLVRIEKYVEQPMDNNAIMDVPDDPSVDRYANYQGDLYTLLFTDELLTQLEWLSGGDLKQATECFEGLGKLRDDSVEVLKQHETDLSAACLRFEQLVAKHLDTPSEDVATDDDAFMTFMKANKHGSSKVKPSHDKLANAVGSLERCKGFLKKVGVVVDEVKQSHKDVRDVSHLVCLKYGMLTFVEGIANGKPDAKAKLAKAVKEHVKPDWSCAEKAFEDYALNPSNLEAILEACRPETDARGKDASSKGNKDDKGKKASNKTETRTSKGKADAEEPPEESAQDEAEGQKDQDKAETKEGPPKKEGPPRKRTRGKEAGEGKVGEKRKQKSDTEDSQRRKVAKSNP